MIGPTKAEAVADLIEVVNFDPTAALSPVQVMCPDCNGATGVEETDPVCATCNSTGSIQVVGWDLEKMTPAFRRNIQDIKHDKKGYLVLSFRNKDRAATELKTMLGWDKPGMRHASGEALTQYELDQRQDDLVASVNSLTRERIITDMMALADDPMTSAAERINILKTVAQMQGFIAVTGEAVAETPSIDDFYSGVYNPTPGELAAKAGDAPA